MGFEARKVRAHPRYAHPAAFSPSSLLSPSLVRVLEYYRRFSTSAAFARPPSAPQQLHLSFGDVRSTAHDRYRVSQAPSEDDYAEDQKALEEAEEERRYRHIWAEEDEITWE